MDKDQIAIVGGGPVGSLLAILLAQRGMRVDIYERRPDPRIEGDVGGRSINLALSRRGLDALEPAGLKDAMMSLAIQMKGRMIHANSGELTFQPYGIKETDYINAVSRGALNRALLKTAEATSGVTLHFDEQCLDVNFSEPCLTLRRTGESNVREVQAVVIFGCDGANSAVRHSLAKIPRYSVSQEYIEYGYKELTIPPGRDGGYLLEKNALHIWPRGGYMLIALPNLDGSFTCTLFYPYEGAESFSSLRAPADVRAFFDSRFPDAAALIPNFVEMFMGNPIGALATIKCRPWNYSGKALILGDAAHGIVPFLGQGLNAALEGVSIFIEILDAHRNNMEEAFTEYSRIRKPDTDAVAEMALENFIEMRDRVADAHFLLRKKVERALEERFQPKFQSRYGLIQFQRTPYATARSRGQINEYIISELCEAITSPDQLDWKAAEQLINLML